MSEDNVASLFPVRAFVKAYEFVFHERLNQQPSATGGDDLSTRISRIVQDLLKNNGYISPEDTRRMIDSLSDVQEKADLCVVFLYADMKGQSVSAENLSFFLKQYHSLTGQHFPPDIYKQIAFHPVILKDLAELSTEAAQHYLEQYPLDWSIYSDYIKKEYPDIKATPDPKAIREQIDRKDGRSYSLNEILAVRDPDTRKVLLDRCSKTVGNADVILLNAQRLSLEDPDFKAHLETAIKKTSYNISFEIFLSLSSENQQAIRGTLLRLSEEDPSNVLIGLSNHIDKHYDVLAPFFEKIRPRIHSLFQEEDISGTTIVITTNELHNRSRAERFSVVDGFTSAEIFSVLTASENMLYTSSFNGLFNIFLDRMKSEGESLITLAETNEQFLPNLPTLMKEVATFNRGRDLLNAVSDQDKILLLDSTIPDNTTRDANGQLDYDVITMCSFISALDPLDPVIKMVESRLIQNYLSTENLAEKTDIALVANWYINNLKRTPSPENAAFFKKFAENPEYSLPNSEVLPISKLINSQGKNFQMHIFYNDDDGIYSYETFRTTLEKNGWSGENINGFMKFSKQQNGREVDILISPPEANGEKAKDIRSYVEGQGGKISVLVHRGHSYHTDKSLSQVTSDTQLVFLGGCGGQTNVEKVVEQSPEAQVLSTAGTGRRVINNQLFVDISEYIFNHDAVDWKKMKEEWGNRAINDESLRFDYSNYMAPYENWILLFSRKKMNYLEEHDVPSSELRGDFRSAVSPPHASLLPPLLPALDSSGPDMARNNPSYSLGTGT